MICKSSFQFQLSMSTNWLINQVRHLKLWGFNNIFQNYIITTISVITTALSLLRLSCSQHYYITNNEIQRSVFSRSSHSEMFYKQGHLKNFTKFSRKQVPGCRLATLSKRDSSTNVFVSILRDFLGHHFNEPASEFLLLNFCFRITASEFPSVTG